MSVKFRRLSDERPESSDRSVAVGKTYGSSGLKGETIDVLHTFSASSPYIQDVCKDDNTRYWFYLDEIKLPAPVFTPKERAAASQIVDFINENPTLLPAEIQDAVVLVCRIGGFDEDRLIKLLKSSHPEVARQADY